MYIYRFNVYVQHICMIQMRIYREALINVIETEIHIPGADAVDGHLQRFCPSF